MHSAFAYMTPLLELVEQHQSTGLRDMGREHVRVHGLPLHQEGSPISREDAMLDGFLESSVVQIAMFGAFDTILGLRDALSAEIVSSATPWTLTRQALESSSLALWVLAGSTAKIRMERTLRVWHYDIEEWDKWRLEAGHPEPADNMRRGEALPMKKADRLARVRLVAQKNDLRPTQVQAVLSFADAVGAAGDAAGLDRKHATATWRAASGFAHSRIWVQTMLQNMYRVGSREDFEEVLTTFREEIHSQAIDVLFPIVETAIARYKELAAPAL